MIPLQLPVLGRLSLADYRRIFLTWTLLILDGIVRLLLFLIPSPVRSMVDWWRFQFLYLLFPMRMFKGFRDDEVHPVTQLSHIGDICSFWYFGLD